MDVLSTGSNKLVVTLPISLPLKDVSYYASNQEWPSEMMIMNPSKLKFLIILYIIILTISIIIVFCDD